MRLSHSMGEGLSEGEFFPSFYFARDRDERDSSVALLPQNDMKGIGQNDKK
jgi:hypothetical protein